LPQRVAGLSSKPRQLSLSDFARGADDSAHDPATDRIAFEPGAWQEQDRSWLRARTRVGNIAFAGTDAASNAMTESAIEEAHRAINSLIDS